VVGEAPSGLVPRSLQAVVSVLEGRFRTIARAVLHTLVMLMCQDRHKTETQCCGCAVLLPVPSTVSRDQF
jgi:hypothetical protein